MYSTDGINWNATNGLEDNNWYGVAYGGGKFVAVAESGDNRVMYSVDGANWTQNFVGLTLTDTTVSRASDGSLIEGTSIDQVLTVGEVVRPLGSKSSWVVETDIDEGAKGIDYDSNGNVYVAYKRSGGSGVSKFDADGVLQWKKTFSNGASDNLYNLKVDSSDNIVVSSTTYYGSKARYGIFKINRLVRFNGQNILIMLTEEQRTKYLNLDCILMLRTTYMFVDTQILTLVADSINFIW